MKFLLLIILSVSCASHKSSYIDRDSLLNTDEYKFHKVINKELTKSFKRYLSIKELPELHRS